MFRYPIPISERLRYGLHLLVSVSERTYVNMHRYHHVMQAHAAAPGKTTAARSMHVWISGEKSCKMSACWEFFTLESPSSKNAASLSLSLSRASARACERASEREGEVGYSQIALRNGALYNSNTFTFTLLTVLERRCRQHWMEPYKSISISSRA